MSERFRIPSIVLVLLIAGILLIPGFLGAQTQSASAAKTPPSTKTWAVPRTPDGQPDLQGYWTNLTFTPLQRPAKFGNREFLTDEEIAKAFRQGVQQTYETTYGKTAEIPEYDPTVYALGAWQNGVKPNPRTSLIVDPPDGRIPPLTPGGQRVAAAMKAPVPDDPEKAAGVTFDSTADMTLGVRCLSFGGPPIIPANYNSDFHIVQSPGYVMIEYEWNSEVRVIPLDGRPHLSQNIHRWHGDSRGHWEGNTLVVETTNFRPDATFRGGNANTLKITEYFTRTDQNSIEYKFTIDDPTTWTKPWSAIVPLSHIDGPMFEYACSEGNNGIVNMLAGARAAEKAAATADAKKSSN
jgi:hypothetical protein